MYLSNDVLFIMTEHRYWGWGGEDNDMSARVQNAGLKIIRYPENISRYYCFYVEFDFL